MTDSWRERFSIVVISVNGSIEIEFHENVFFSNQSRLNFCVSPQVAKANGGHKKNVWEIMRCPEYVLKCNKSVHLPARVCFLYLLGDLSAICAASALGDFTT